jgi:crotonobetainyl-CoA:carnitine CoA-transferase CaiB-like acyl-CoA transferase
MTSITPFGQSGPYRDYKGTNLISMHMGGVGYVTPGEVSDREKEPPLKGGGHQGDFVTGITGAAVTMAAVLRREVSGEGQHLDLSAQEAVAINMARDIASYTYEGSIWGRSGPPVKSGGLLPCKDGYVHSWLLEEEQWQAFVEIMGSPEWAKDERFRDRFARHQHWKELEPLIHSWTRQHTREEIYRAAQARKVPLLPVNSMAEVVNSEVLRERGFFLEWEHPEAGRVLYPWISHIKLGHRRVAMVK